MPGWYGVDLDENILFEVCNTSEGEISPDYLIESKIRITDETGLTGFANSKGKIIIKPQFEIATRFNGGLAIIGQECTKKYWESDEGTGHVHDKSCQHYSIVCGKYGYINEKGKILKLGKFTFEEIQSQIGWRKPINH